MPNPEFLTDLGINLKVAIAGFWGGVCHCFVFRLGSPLAAVGSVLVGTFTANYLGQVAVRYVGDWIGELGSGFIVGLTAMVICQGVVVAARGWRVSKTEDPKNA